jgi:hypothetical protein
MPQQTGNRPKKRGRRRILATMLGLAFLAALAYWAVRPEPARYQGKTTAGWLQEFSLARTKTKYRILVPLRNGQIAWQINENSLASDPSAIALRRLGTNAAAYLGKRIERSLNPFNQEYTRLYLRTPRSLSRVLPHPYSAEEEVIASALEVLGPEATPAVPALIQSLSRGTAYQRFVYLQCLHLLHFSRQDIDPALEALAAHREFPDAVNVISILHVHTATAARVLLQAISGTNSIAAAQAWTETPHFSEHAGILLPAITAVLAQEEADAQIKALHVLQAFGSEALPAVPALVRSLQNTNEEVRYESARAFEAMGTNAQFALDALYRATNDPSIMVQRCSTRVISNLTYTLAN